MINVEIADPPVGRAIMVRFPRAKLAAGTIAVFIGIFGLPWLVVPFIGNESGLSDLTVSVAIVLVLALLFGWYLILLMITALRGGFLALAQEGVLIQPGLSSVLIPWTAVKGVSIGDDGTRARNPVLRVQLRAGIDLPGWPWPIALQPTLLGSSRHELKVLGWWFQPVSADRLAAIIRFLVRHPDERRRIGSVDPDVWDADRVEPASWSP